MTGWGGGLRAAVMVLFFAAACGLGLIALLVDLKTGGQIAGVVGAIASLIGLILSFNAPQQQPDSSSPDMVNTTGERSSASIGSPRWETTGDNNTIVNTIINNFSSQNHPPHRLWIGAMGLMVAGTFAMILFSFLTQQPPVAKGGGEVLERGVGVIPESPAPNVPCLRGCRDLQLSEGQDFDIETWRSTGDTSSDIAAGNNSLQDYKLWPLNGAGIQPIPNIPSGGLDAADCPTDGGYSTDAIPIPPTIPFCLLTAEGNRVMLMGQDGLNLPFRPFLTSTFRP